MLCSPRYHYIVYIVGSFGAPAEMAVPPCFSTAQVPGNRPTRAFRTPQAQSGDQFKNNSRDVTNLQLLPLPILSYSNACAPPGDSVQGSDSSMTTPPIGVERRAGQRFPYHLPVSVCEPASGVEGLGFTQDLSSRGVFFLTDAALRESSEVQLTLKMPSEITLGESMRVRCSGRVLRVVRSGAAHGQELPTDMQAEAKIGVAVRLDGYEYLPDSQEPTSAFARVAALHPQDEAEKTTANR